MFIAPEKPASWRKSGRTDPAGDLFGQNSLVPEELMISVGMGDKALKLNQAGDRWT